MHLPMLLTILMIKMMVTVVAVFVICWLPLNISQVALYFEIIPNNWSGLQILWLLCHWLAMSHSCYNPIIYCYMNARFRVGFLQALSKIPCLRKYLPPEIQRPRSSMAGFAMTGIDAMENSLLQRVNTCTTYVSVRQSSKVQLQQQQHHNCCCATTTTNHPASVGSKGGGGGPGGGSGSSSHHLLPSSRAVSAPAGTTNECCCCNRCRHNSGKDECVGQHHVRHRHHHHHHQSHPHQPHHRQSTNNCIANRRCGNSTSNGRQFNSVYYSEDQI